MQNTKGAGGEGTPTSPAQRGPRVVHGVVPYVAPEQAGCTRAARNPSPPGQGGFLGPGFSSYARDYRRPLAANGVLGQGTHVGDERDRVRGVGMECKGWASAKCK